MRHLKIHKDTLAQEMVVEALERQLARAKAGELIGVAIATIDTGDTCTQDHAGRVGMKLIGALECIKHAIIQDVMY